VGRGVTSCHSRLDTSCRAAVVGRAREVSSLVPFRNISSSTVINKRLAGSQMASKRSAKGRSSPANNPEAGGAITEDGLRPF
jgi:hypothetical protein